MENVKKSNSLKLTILILSFLASIFIIIKNNHGNALVINDSELRYTEISNNLDIKGSIMPASCQSYPVDPTLAPAHFTGDTSGHCTDSCPSGYQISLVNYTKCYYSFDPCADLAINRLLPIDTANAVPVDGTCRPAYYSKLINYVGNVVDIPTLCENNNPGSGVYYNYSNRSLNTCTPIPVTPNVNINFNRH